MGKVSYDNKPIINATFVSFNINYSGCFVSRFENLLEQPNSYCLPTLYLDDHCYKYMSDASLHVSMSGGRAHTYISA